MGQQNSKLMKSLSQFLTTVFGLIAVLVFVYFTVLYYNHSKSAKPSNFENEIATFEAKDKAEFPESGQVLFIGSSSIRRWKTLEQDMAPIRVINRGFGGSMIHHSTYYADRIMVPYKPSAIVLYGRSNDISNWFSRRSPEELAKDFDAFVLKVREEIGQIPVLYISIKPTKLRQKRWGQMVEANELISIRAQSDPLITYVDVATHMLDKDGKPRDEFFVWDGLHMNEKGYALWTLQVQPVLDDVLASSKIHEANDIK